MIHVVKKVSSAGNDRIFITERGTMFGYNNLVSDLRSIRLIQHMGYPVVFDATHSVQLPGGADKSSGGQREFAPLLARAAVAAGADGLFLEVHPRPADAASDGSNMLQLDRLEPLIEDLLRLRSALT